MRTALLALLVLAQKDPSSTKEAMKAIQFLVGEWTVTYGDKADAAKGWEETQSWEYKIDKTEYQMQVSIKDGKLFKEGLVSYDLKKKVYRWELTRLDGKKATFEGKLAAKELSAEEVVDDKTPQEKMAFTFLREGWFLMSFERREAGKKVWDDLYEVQHRKKGVAFVKNEGPKCVVTGGTGSMAVEYQGKTYYVC
jgi:hypothetical protein